jgi:hypothetical protein
MKYCIPVKQFSITTIASHGVRCLNLTVNKQRNNAGDVDHFSTIKPVDRIVPRAEAEINGGRDA